MGAGRGGRGEPDIQEESPMFMSRCTLAVSTVLLAGSVASAAPQLGDTRSDQFLCGQTSHFRVDMGDGTSMPFSVSSAFTLDTTLEYAGGRDKPPKNDVYVWKVKSRSTMGGVMNNPLYQGSSTGGANPLFDASSIWVNPINDPPLADGNAELLVELPGTGEPEGDRWSNTRLRVQFLDAKGNVLASYISEGVLDLIGDESGSALLAGDRFFNYPKGPRPARAMIAESSPRGADAMPSLYLDSIVFSTNLVPTPGAGALIGLAGVAALRRRR
jgi:hypothetical protein